MIAKGFDHFVQKNSTMKITLEGLHILQTIVKEGSFEAAAAKLFKVRSALTHSIKKMENDLGVTLFDRTGHKAHLTEMGAYVLEEGEKLLKGAEHFENTLHLKKSGWESKITIALDELIPFECLFPLIKDFEKECPHTKLNITLERLNGCWDALYTNRASMAIGTTGYPPLNLPYETTPLGKLSMIFAVSKNHPLAQKAELNYKDIEKETGIIVSDTSTTIPKLNSGLYAKQKTITFNSMHAKVKAQAQGLGVGYLPKKWAAPYLQTGELIEKTTEKLKSSALFSTAWRHDHKGKALDWWIQKMKDPETRAYLTDG